MSLFDQFKSKPLVVQRLAFLWFVFAFYGLAYTCISGLVSHDWRSLPWSSFFGLLFLDVSWSHFKQQRHAWYVGLAISGVVGTVLGFGILGAVTRLQEIEFEFSDLIDRSFYKGDEWSYERILVLLSCHFVTGFGLMVIATILARSRAGRVAFGIPPVTREPMLVKPKRSKSEQHTDQEKDKFLIL